MSLNEKHWGFLEIKLLNSRLSGDSKTNGYEFFFSFSNKLSSLSF